MVLIKVLLTKISEKAFNPNPTILYAGNIGQGQGLEKIIPKALKYYRQSFKFVLVGDGGRRKKLENKLFD